MAILKNTTTGELISLRTLHIFGRDQRVDTCFNHPEISRVHGVIGFNGQTWQLKDFSRNGIYYNGQAVDSEQGVELQLGGDLAFTLNRQSQLQWQVINLDHNDQSAQSENRPESQADNALSSADLQFHFQVSPDEEHVFVKVQADNKRLDMGERVHHYPLLLLARKRCHDLKNGFDMMSQGWMDVDYFKTLLGVNNTVLNMQMYRAKNQLSALLPGKLPLIERRCGELRFACPNFTILRGGSIEVELGCAL